MKIVVTGAAGFIGHHLVTKLLSLGHEVVGFDNINDYYSVSLKYARLSEQGILEEDITDNNFAFSHLFSSYKFIKMDLTDKVALFNLFEKEKFEYVIHLAAQAGVRYSIENPSIYIQSNIEGFFNILEACRAYPVKHLVYASSSSVYGNNTKVPFSVDDNVDHPVSLYAATKKTNELMAHTYSHLFNIPTTGLRFFTVYGPWGRPDMAPSLFTDAIINNRTINVFNEGDMERDFTYIDDIIEGICSIFQNPKKKTNDTAPYAIHNIGSSNPIQLLDFITAIEKKLKIEARKKLMPMQPGDVKCTYADISSLENAVNYAPKTSLKKGVKKFIDWYIQYHLANDKKPMTIAV